MPITGVPDFANLTRHTQADTSLFNLTWSGASFWDSGGGNAPPPGPDSFDLAGIDRVALGAGADFVTIAIQTLIAMRVDGTGGAYPGLNLFENGTLAPTRSTVDGTVSTLVGEDTSPSASSNANTDNIFVPPAGGWLINPSPPSYPGKDSGDVTNDTLWTIAQAAAITDTFAVEFEDGNLRRVGTGVGGGTANSRYWQLGFLPFTVNTRLMCVL